MQASEAIQLALDTDVNTLPMDESEGSRRHHLKVTGTVAILEKASQHGLIDLRSMLERLERTSFRLSASIRQEFLNRNP